ncbi:hypothetical protein ACH4VT_33100 [Streptomyces lydicus]|uniref:hypothetical protein n=1 Tax=Streptomyces lydicus TaxID=47763 RepID=UPI00379BA350
MLDVVEELLRLVSVFDIVIRVATADITIEGHSLGQNLARTELDMAFRSLLARFLHLDLDGGPPPQAASSPAPSCSA